LWFKNLIKWLFNFFVTKQKKDKTTIGITPNQDNIVILNGLESSRVIFLVLKFERQNQNTRIIQGARINFVLVKRNP
jgi:hypothetical protein